MSEHFMIDKDKQQKLQNIILKLHQGASVAEVKKEFATLIQGVSAAEVAQMEQALIDNGMPVEEIQHLCEVHVEVFKASLDKEKISSKVPGHPVQTMLDENKAARARLRALKKAVLAWRFGLGQKEQVLAALDDMSKIIVHYTRKENQLFPYLEKKEFTGPSRVMWGKHDEIRALFKEAHSKVEQNDKSAISSLHPLAGKISRMIFMEEHILIPEAVRRLSDEEWAHIRIGEDAIGFAWIRPGAVYDPYLVLAGAVTAKPQPAAAIPESTAIPAVGATHHASPVPASDLVELATGKVPAGLLSAALATMPVDISIVDAQDKVVYYSDSPDRIFPRSPAVIGRAVQNCHPQKSVATVNRILDAFRKKEKTRARFWLEMGGRFILIEYRALYDAAGAYIGTLEFSQDLTELRTLQGQRRLLDWD
ncbi:conserved hypothetical protein [uncultured spirochete]|jgi:Uncharacterized conserved protein|uniref:DUF438 domain-containing protein n=1 Tax=uncultured spirochete TaxID=156406 RepID=A0A3P3XJ28_9SPIR|nr:DUF438 domain-containing protein [Rectinema subterraneum]SLM12251.1 conserved hypothetical protein [uncultured spirochete]